MGELRKDLPPIDGGGTDREGREMATEAAQLMVIDATCSCHGERR